MLEADLRPAAVPEKKVNLDFAALLNSRAEEGEARNPKGSVRTDGRITLRTDKPEFFLGENILLHYCVENTGTQAFVVSVGGDYRGAGRATRFRVTVEDERGREMVDPLPPERLQLQMGGLSPLNLTKPGETWFEDVPVLHYRTIERSGTFTVRVFHDMGWGAEEPRDKRTVSVQIVVREPSAEQALQVLADLDKAKSYNGKTWGQKGQATPDYRLLQHSNYLAPLVERAAAGDSVWVTGIASIGTVDATRALLQLTAHPSNSVAAASAAALRLRMPKSSWKAKERAAWTPDEMRGLKAPATNTWQLEFSALARTNAVRLLARPNDACFAAAAAVLGWLGHGSDPPALMTALDGALAWPFVKLGTPVPATPRWASQQLVAALDELAAVDVPMPASPTTAGEFLGFLAGVGRSENFSPPGWEASFERALKHEAAMVREAALGRLPRPLPAAFHQPLVFLMADPDNTVCRLACEKANNLQLAGGRAFALKAIAMSTDHWTVWMAKDAAVRDGGRMECAEMLAKRFAEVAGDPQFVGMNFMRHLVEITLGGHMSGSWQFLREPGGQEKANALRDEWLKVIRYHAEDLRAGRLLVMGQGFVTTNLVPPGVGYEPPRK
ncbi:MAG: hypothetical protein ABMA26_11410 [Limisphaerales bacterium]